MSDITIRSMKTAHDAALFQELQRRVWGKNDEVEIIPASVIVTIKKSGGVFVGAFSEEGPPELKGLVGSGLGWLGARTDDDGTFLGLKLSSHIVGVLPEWQGKGVGYRVKLGQREEVLAQGLTDWMTWTFDPLYLPNGILNINRLGATCTTYGRNIYGYMNDDLNAGAPTDRCQVDWRLKSKRVMTAISPDRPKRSLLYSVDPKMITMLPVKTSSTNLQQPVEAALSQHLNGAPIAMPIPDDIAAIRRTDNQLGLAWRMYVREVIESAFAAGYAVMDCQQLENNGRPTWHYILAQEELPK
ncbi:MAG: hypothetical protein AAF639_13745 [Chloroflexota bacterium]